MPEERSAPQVQTVDLETAPLRVLQEKWADDEALSLVNQTFSHYENWRQVNHDQRWKMHDMLYFGASAPRVWEGTGVPKANLSQPIVFDQIEAAMPQIINALFGGDTWFDVEPEAGGSIEEARDVKAHLDYILTHGNGEAGLSVVNELEIAARSVCQYGNGGVHLQWDFTKKEPIVKWLDIRDLYIDPATPTPNIDEARSVILRKTISVEEIDSWRGEEAFNIPDRDILVGMSRKRTGVAADETKRNQEAQRGVRFTPGSDDSLPNPADKQIEVLFYNSRGQEIWVLNREWVAYNAPNPYGFNPFAFGFCYLVPSRFYAMSMADVLEDNQLYIQALMNAKLDELSLAISPPRTVTRAGNMTNSELRWRPGAISRTTDPSKDVVMHPPSGATANVSEDIMYLKQDAAQRTGVGGPASGQFAPGNVNRTKGGVDAQVQGASQRLQPIVKHIEEYLIVPMLNKLYRMIQHHTEPTDVLPGVSQGKFIQVGAAAFKAPMKFRMQAASMMMTQAALQQQFPFITQYLLAAPFMSHLNTIGQTVDFQELLKMLQDATGTSKKYQFIRPMNPQEQQAASQPDPKTVMQQQLAQQDAQVRLQMGQMKAQSEIQKAQIAAEASGKDAEERSSFQLMQLMANQDAQQQEEGRATAKMQQEMALKSLAHNQQLQQNAQMHHQKMAQTGEKAAMDAKIQSQKAYGDAVAQQLGSQNDLQVQSASGANKLQHDAVTASQKQLLTEMAHRQKMKHGAEKHAQDLKASKAEMSVLAAGNKKKGK